MSVSPSPEANTLPQRRSAPRLRTVMHAQIIVSHGRGSAIVQDVSSHGARVRIESPYPTEFAISLGQRGILRMVELEVLFRTVWEERGNAGLMFEEHVPPCAIARLRHAFDSFRNTEARRFGELNGGWRVAAC